MEDYKNTNWWKYLDEPMRDLMAQSFELLERESGRAGEFRFHDYGFVVFPAAKAYEGFLKKVFLEMGLINELQYRGEHFRIGRALSPTLPKRYRAGWVYGKLVNSCGGDVLPLKMWKVWKDARNRVFHFFPDHSEFTNLTEAGWLLKNISDVMGDVLEGCRL